MLKTYIKLQSYYQANQKRLTDDLEITEIVSNQDPNEPVVVGGGTGAGAGAGFTAKQAVIAYVESLGNDTTAAVGDISKPYLTVGAALDALGVNGGTVKIGMGTFASPAQAKIKSHTYFIGSGKRYHFLFI